MPRAKDGFDRLPELGARLRELRLKAGLSLEEAVRRMRRSKGFASRLSRLEQGKLKVPSIVLVVDYLRVCRARVSDLGPALDPYTDKRVPLERAGDSQVRAVTRDLPPKVTRALVSYDISTTVARESAGQKPLEPDMRELRVRRQAQAWLERGRLDRVLHVEMDNLGVLPLMAVRKFAFDYGHKLWRILKTTRPKPGRTAAWREQSREARLAEAEQEAQKQSVIPLSGLQLIGRLTQQLFAKMEKLGELDTLPALAVCAQVEKPLSMKYKAKATAAQTIAASLPYRPEYLPSVTLEAMKQMEEKGVKGDPLRRYQFWLGQVQSVALETQPNSAERAQRVEALAGATENPALSRQVADIYLTAFERWRPKLFR